MDKIRFGVLGCADIAVSRVIPNLRHSRKVSIAALASRSVQKAGQWAKKLGIEKSYGSYSEMLSDESIDAVYVPLPNSLHAEWSIAALEMGKHVLCEKPLALTANEVARMIQSAHAHGLVIMEGFMYRFHPRNRAVFEMVKQGEIGRLLSIESSFSYVLEDEGSYLLKKDLGGGSLYDVGCYCVNVSRMLTGIEPAEVSGMADFRKSGVDLSFSGIMRFDSGVLSTFHVSMREQDRFDYRVVGDRGLIEVPWAFVSFGKKMHITVRKGEEEHAITFASEDEYVNEFDHFADVVSGRDRMLYPIEDALGNAAVLESLLQSAHKKKYGIPSTALRRASYNGTSGM